jgi:hypothetical protein
MKMVKYFKLIKEIARECLNDILNKIINIDTNQIQNNNPNQFNNFLMIIQKTQENIINMTGMAKEKIKNVNEIGINQLKEFKENSIKYGKYLKSIHSELIMISDLIK